MTDLAVHPTDIPGLLIVDLPVHGDSRGWFKENWQRAKMTALGLPDFAPVQHNVSFNDERGVTRGIHAEPWDKYVSVVTGAIFGAWVDLREGPTHGQVVTCEIGPDRAVFVPRGVGNSYQTLEPATAYSYLVTEHWSPAARDRYTFVALHDTSLGIDWPIPLEETIRSEADLGHPLLADSIPVRKPHTLVLGAGGQLGRALLATLPNAVGLTRAECDLADPASVDALDLADVDAIVNAAAYTAVDAAETAEGRTACWAVNVTAVGALVRQARAARATLVHVSSDYVFDGTAELHTEDEPFSPLGVYGQTKAAGDAVVSVLPRHYVIRTSWVIGDGHNFVRTMASLAARGVKPSVVDDQYGRLTFTSDLAASIKHLVDSAAPFGTYNVTCDGPVLSWFDIAQRVYELVGANPSDVSPQSSAEYAAGKTIAPRPQHSTLALDKVKATGFAPVATIDGLTEYLTGDGRR